MFFHLKINSVFVLKQGSFLIVTFVETSNEVGILRGLFKVVVPVYVCVCVCQFFCVKLF